MRDISTKVSGSFLTPDEFNDIPSEMENVITDAGITLSSGDLTQLSKAIAVYAASGDFYNDTGAVNAYVLAPLASKKGITAYSDGQRFRYIPDNTNTGASTVNVNTVGVVDIVLDGNVLVGGELPAGQTVTLRYDTASGDVYIEDVSNKLFIDGQIVSINGYRIDLAIYSEKSFSVASEDTNPQDLFIKPDGDKVYVIGESSDTVYQYSIPTPWDISTTTIDVGKDFSVVTEDAFPVGLFIKPDGTKLYVMGSVSNTIYQYSLSPAWDISTATVDVGKTFSVATEDTGPTGIFFKPDGLKVYMIGNTNNTIYQYSLSPAWDISTATYDTKLLSVATEDTAPQDLFFKPDGLKAYVIGQSSNAVYQYTLTTAWDISTATVDVGKEFSVASEETSPTGLFIKPDGAHTYITGSINDTIYQYSTNILRV